LWSKLPPTLRVPYQSDASSPSSSPSPGFDPGLVVDNSHGVFHFYLKAFFLEVFPSIAIYSLLKLIWNLTTRVFGSDWRRWCS